MKLKTGIIGCGKVADFHARAYKSLPQSELSGLCSHNIHRAEELAGKYGNVRAYDNVEEMIRREKLDVVSICTPHPVHAQDAIIAANLGCHVLIEKPLASNLQDCDAIIEAGERNRVTLGTIVQRRFYQPCMRIRNALDAGKLGRPILGMVTMLGWRDEVYYRSDPWRGSWKGEGGGVMVNQAPHQFDLLLWYMGEIDELYGLWKNLNHPYIEVEDTAAVVIKFKNGGMGNILVSNSQNPALFGKVHIFGENGSTAGVQTDGGAMFIAGMTTITEPPYNDIWTIPGETESLAAWKKEDAEFFNRVDSLHYFHERQIEDFLDAVLQKRRPLVDALDGRKTVELFTAVYRSTRDNKPIKFPLSPE